MNSIEKYNITGWSDLKYATLKKSQSEELSHVLSLFDKMS